MFAGRKHDNPPVFRLRLGYCLTLEPVAQSDPCQNPKLIMEFILVPPRRVPSEGEVLIELHQLASMKNARSKVVHLCAPFPQGETGRVSLEEGSESLCGARHFMRNTDVARFAVD